MKKTLICITCPIGCVLDVAHDKDKITEVKGNLCPRGEEYAAKEVFHPERVLTTTVSVKGAVLPLVSVRTERSVPRELSFKIIECANKVQLSAPVKVGDIVVKNILGTGVNLIATRNLGKPS